MNYRDYQRECENGFKHDFPDELSSTIVRDDISRVFNASRLCKSYVFSWRCYVDLLTRDISELYEKTSDCGKKFESLTHENFDNFFEYRFLYQLRNMGPHIETMLPIAHYESDGKFAPCFDKQSLIESHQFKDKHFRDDSVKLPRFIPAQQILEQSLAVMEEFHKSVLLILRTEIVRYSENAIKYQNDFGPNRAGYGTVNTISETDKLHYSFFLLPYEIALKVIAYYSNDS